MVGLVRVSSVCLIFKVGKWIRLLFSCGHSDSAGSTRWRKTESSASITSFDKYMNENSDHYDWESVSAPGLLPGHFK